MNAQRPRLDAALQQLIVDQVGRELIAQRIYSATDLFWTRRRGYSSAQDFCEAAAKEEYHHARQIIKYLVEVADIDPADFDEMPDTPPQRMSAASLLEVFEFFWQMECEFTQFLQGIVDHANTVSDHETVEFFSEEFLREQTKSERQLFKIVMALRSAGNDPAAIAQVEKRINKIK